jgi:hypothetical protein
LNITFGGSQRGNTAIKTALRAQLTRGDAELDAAMAALNKGVLPTANLQVCVCTTWPTVCCNVLDMLMYMHAYIHTYTYIHAAPARKSCIRECKARPSNCRRQTITTPTRKANKELHSLHAGRLGYMQRLPPVLKYDHDLDRDRDRDLDCDRDECEFGNTLYLDRVFRSTAHWCSRPSSQHCRYRPISADTGAFQCVYLLQALRLRMICVPADVVVDVFMSDCYLCDIFS